MSQRHHLMEEKVNTLLIDSRVEGQSEVEVIQDLNMLQNDIPGNKNNF